jgi:sodium-coupled neutral amino acid transporter 9
MCLRNLGVILKLVPLGIVSVVTFFFFIIYKGCANLASQGVGVFSHMKWATLDVTTIAGVFTMGLMVQSLIVPIMKNNAKQEHNRRDIGLGNFVQIAQAFGWTWFVYQVVGIFGAIAIAGVEKRPGTAGATVLDFFKDDWMVYLVEVLNHSIT